MKTNPRNKEAPEILIVDDHAVVRSGLEYMIKGKYSDASFVGCENGDDALQLISSRQFDLVLLEVSIPGKDGIVTLQDIKAKEPALPVIMLSVFREETYAIRAFKLGAAAYLQKCMDHESLLLAIEVVLAGQRYMSPKQAAEITEKLDGKDPPSGVDSLSPKEHLIFLRLAAGKSLKEIGADLKVSPKTVTTYRSRILEKLKLNSNAAIAKYALKLGLIE